MAKILLACEESQAVTKEFRKLGHDAYSCDILSTSGDHPEWHLQQDVILLLDQEWDLIIAFPPCTHLAASGARWFEKKRKDGRQQEGIDFFMKFTDVKCDRVAIENPVGIMNNIWRKPDQIINPYQFGDPFEKRTCLWLKNVPKLIPTNIVEPPPRNVYKSGTTMPAWYSEAKNYPKEICARIRSRTFQGIAEAKAEQWSKVL